MELIRNEIFYLQPFKIEWYPYPVSVLTSHIPAQKKTPLQRQNNAFWWGWVGFLTTCRSSYTIAFPSVHPVLHFQIAPLLWEKKVFEKQFEKWKKDDKCSLSIYYLEFFYLGNFFSMTTEFQLWQLPWILL